MGASDDSHYGEKHMSKAILTPSKFKQVVSRARYELDQAVYWLSEIRDAAGEGDERCKQFITEHRDLIRMCTSHRTSLYHDAERIVREVEEKSAAREGKSHCALCNKNVRNMRDHERRSVSHKGRVRVAALDKSPDWTRISRSNGDSQRIVESLLMAPPPDGAPLGQEYRWTKDQKSTYNQMVRARQNHVSDIVLIQEYEYHQGGSVKKWGEDSGKYWVSPYILEHKEYLTSIMRDIRTKNNLGTYGDHHLVGLEFQKIIDPIIRNPNAIKRHAAMHALQFNRGD